MAQDNRFKIYRATNHTKAEIYIGVARDCFTRFDKHAGILAGGASCIQHWDWFSDDIATYTYPYRFNSKQQASFNAHDIERACRIPFGYEVHLTRGT